MVAAGVRWPDAHGGGFDSRRFHAEQPAALQRAPSEWTLSGLWRLWLEHGFDALDRCIHFLPQFDL
jgi:hypothetical protein